MAVSLYNQVGYPGFPFAQTHPDRLATIAALCGLSFAPVETCRVLEIGCGDGGNLIPMAVAFPHACFTGFDLAETPIASGCKIVADLNLQNIKLRAADAMTVDSTWGQFDYIITHGLYSWSPPGIRDQILKISKENLSPEGIAFVSYNALPGSRIRQMLRDMMLFQVSDLPDPEERIQQAQALLGFVATARTRPDALNELINAEVDRIRDREPWALFHDELADVYEPVYFHQFMEHAEQHSLQFLAEADLPELQETGLTPEAIGTLAAIADHDRVLREQYRDFANGRSFRQTLLCHQGRILDFPPKPERLKNLYISTAANQIGKGEFAGPNGARLKTLHPQTIKAMKGLIAKSPEAVPATSLNVDFQTLLSATLRGITELHTAPRPLVTRPGKCPIASPLIRYQLSENLPLTTLHHATLRLEDAEDRKLIVLLDGTYEPDGPDEKDRVARLARLGVFVA